MARLFEVTAAFSKALTPTEVAEVVIGQGVAALDATAGRILVLSEDGASLRMIGSVGYPPGLVDRWQRVPIDRDVPIAVAARTGAPIWVGSRAELLDHFPYVSRIPTVTQAFAAIPLIVDDRSIGAMGLSFDQPRDFDVAERDFISALALQCAQALERARLFEAEQQAREVAEAAVRARDEFLSIAAHELRTPLTAVKAAGQLLARTARRVDDSQPQLTRLTLQLDSQITRLEALVNDLLDVTRLQLGRLQLHPSRVDLVELSWQVLARCEEIPERKRDHVLVLDAVEAIEAICDPIRIDQVLTNLVSNALKYSPSGGEVRVRLRRQGETVEITVIDHGIGVAPELQAQIFQRFVQYDPVHHASGQGLGLGLYITAQIVEQHGGTISVASEPGIGSTFSVRLPRSGPAERSDGTPTRGGSVGATTARMLWR